MADRLNGYRILILESREEAQFSRLLQDQGADVVQCPMFTIHDAPDPAPVEAWIRRAIETPFDDLILTTGEGLRRLTKLAQTRGLDQAFIAAIGKSRIVARGPKPGKALREIGLTPQITTETPTSDGIAQTMAGFDLKRHRVGIQLYPEKDHGKLLNALHLQGATVDPVLPYVYDAEAADANIVAAIDEMVAGRIDAIALTSSGQVRRLIDAARKHGCEERLRQGLAMTRVASVGPVVSDELKAHGFQTDIAPTDGAFFMKPLISAMAARLAAEPRRVTSPLAGEVTERSEADEG